MENEWYIRRAESLHTREQALVDSFYKKNPDFPKMLAFRVNSSLEYEGVVYGFISGEQELQEKSDNPSLWAPIGVMTSGGDFVLRYTRVKNK